MITGDLLSPCKIMHILLWRVMGYSIGNPHIPCERFWKKMYRMGSVNFKGVEWVNCLFLFPFVLGKM